MTQRPRFGRCDSSQLNELFRHRVPHPLCLPGDVLLVRVERAEIVKDIAGLDARVVEQAFAAAWIDEE